MTKTLTFRRRDQSVQAIRYVSPRDIKDIEALIGVKVDDMGIGYGDWVFKSKGGHWNTWSHNRFMNSFEEVK